ncbi:MAG: type II secretion system protein [Syntrophus sp. (in: bacteria)]
MKNEAGFTLIEIIVSLILVGIMASMAGMGIVAGVKGYLFAKDNAAVSGKAQLAMSRMSRTFMEVLDITTVGTSPVSVTYDRLSNDSRITETLYWDTTGHTIKIASGGSASGGDILVDNVSSLALTYWKGTQPWVRGTDDFSLLSTVGVTLILTRPDGGTNVTLSTVITPRNNANRGGSTSTALPSTTTPGGGCFVATAAFGQPDHPTVLLLREFRDRYLLTWAGGRLMVKIYYAGGPYLADLIQGRSWACTLTQWVLLPFTGMAFLMLYAPQAVPFIFLLSWVAVSIFFKFIRRRQKMVTSVTVNQRGTILLGLIGTMVIFSVLGAAMLSFTNSSTLNQVTSTGSARAYYLAEGGMRYAGSQFKNASDEDAKDVMLESLNNKDFSMGSDGTFHLDVYPYYFKTTAIPSGTTLSAKFTGSVPTDMVIPATGYLKIGNSDTTPRPYTGRTQSGSNITFTMSPGLTGFSAVVNNVLPVGQAASTTLTRGGNLTLSSGAGAFPLVNGTFTIGTATSTIGTNPAVFAYKTRSGNVLQYVTLSQDQTSTGTFSVSVPANAYITLMKFVNLSSRGTYTPLQASRTISYSVPIGFVSASGSGPGGKSTYTGTLDNNQELTDHWFSTTGVLGSFTTEAVGSNSAMHVTGTYDVSILWMLVSRQSLISFNWSSTGVNLNQSWSLADYLLSYDTQVKIRVNGQDYYMVGLLFRVDAAGQSYGVSYLRANTGTSWLGSDNDGIPDSICPLNKQAMIVLWQETPANTVKWLAYKTLSSVDGVIESNNNRLVDWSTLLVRVIEADSLSFDQGGPGTTGELLYGDTITGATSGATAKVNGTPILTSGAWTGTAAGLLTVTNVSKTGGVIQFQSGENLTTSTGVNGAPVVRARYTGTSRQKDNYIRVYYGSQLAIPTGTTGNAYPLGNIRLANTRLAAGGAVPWPVDNVAGPVVVPVNPTLWAANNDYFTLVQWNTTSGQNQLNAGNGEAILGTGSELNAIVRLNALHSPSSGTFTQPEVGLDTWGNSSTSVYYDDFGIQTASPAQTQGFLPAIQQ